MCLRYIVTKFRQQRNFVIILCVPMTGNPLPFADGSSVTCLARVVLLSVTKVRCCRSFRCRVRAFPRARAYDSVASFDKTPVSPTGVLAFLAVALPMQRACASSWRAPPHVPIAPFMHHCGARWQCGPACRAGAVFAFAGICRKRKTSGDILLTNIHQCGGAGVAGNGAGNAGRLRPRCAGYG